MKVCARCRSSIGEHETDGESGIYSPDREFILCEACFLEEDAEIETEGTNNLPDRIKQYCENERLGILKKQWS
jgi:hypothetical protein